MDRNILFHRRRCGFHRLGFAYGYASGRGPGSFQLRGGLANHLLGLSQRVALRPAASTSFGASFSTLQRNPLPFGAPILPTSERVPQNSRGPANHFAKVAIEKVEIK